MQIDAEIGLLKEDISAQISRLRTNRSDDKRKAAFVAIYIGVVSAVTTVCIGIAAFIPKQFADIFGVLSLLTSASLTVVTAWDGMFHHKKLWMNSATTLNELYELESDIRHSEASAGEIAQVLVNEFFGRYKEILRGSNERWYKIRE